MIRESSHRLALMLCLALASSAGLVAPSFAQGLAAQSAQISALGDAGKYSEAIPLAEAMLANLEKGAPSKNLAGAMNNLAQLYGDVGRDAEAEPLYMRALAIMEKTVGVDSVEIAPELNNLAALYQRQLRYAEAEPLFKRALALSEKQLPANHPDIGRALNNLATCYEKQDRHAESEALTRRALALYEKVAGPESPAVATLLNNLGQIVKVQGREAEAEPMIKRSLAIREKVLGRDHPDVARSLNNLGDLYQRENRFAEAEPIFKRALAIREQAVGPDHPDTAASVNNLASLYQAEGRAADAIPLDGADDRQGPRAIGYRRLRCCSTRSGSRSCRPRQALDEALDVIQRGTQSSAASAVNKLAVRIAAGNDRLAELVRRDQDLASEAETLDKAVVAALSKQGQRDGAAAQRGRERLAAIAAERASLQKTFATEFPDYSALSNPLPLQDKGNPGAARRRRGDGAVRAGGQGQLCDRADARQFRLEAHSVRQRCDVAKGLRVPPRPRHQPGQRRLRQVEAVRSCARQRALCGAVRPGRGYREETSAAC